jgi:hypothetical protein
MIRTTTSLALVLMLSATSATAASKRSPLFQGEERETELSLTRWETDVVVERTRSFGRKFAVFSADPQAIVDDAVLVFQVESAGEIRWRCVAVDDVAECLGAPVRIRYQAAEETVRLTVKAVARSTDRGSELVKEAKQARELRLLAKG